MSRARNIKPSFFTNDVLAECEPLARLLFAGMWTIADREGRLEDRPKKIKAEVLPYDSCDADILLNQLNVNGFILRYEANGTKYIQILKFSKHQNAHIKEAASIIPAPDEHHTSTVQNVPYPLSPIPYPEKKEEVSLRSTSKKIENEKPKIKLDELSVDHIADWLAEKRAQGRYIHHDPAFVLEKFKDYCTSKGKKYANFVSAYRNAFDWEKCQPAGRNIGNSQSNGRQVSAGVFDSRDPASRAADEAQRIIAKRAACREAEAELIAEARSIGAGPVDAAAVANLRQPERLRGQSPDDGIPRSDVPIDSLRLPH